MLLNLVCAFLSPLVSVTTLENRQGTAADSRYHYHIRPPFRHGNCKVRCSNPTNCGNNSITRASLCKGGLQPRAYGPVSSALDPPEPAPLCLLIDAFNCMQVGRRRYSRRPTSHLLPVEFHRHLCSCTLKSLTRAGPRSVLSYATFGTHQTMPSSFIALVSSLLWAARAPFTKKV